MAGSNCGTIDNRKDGSSNRLYTLLTTGQLVGLDKDLTNSSEVTVVRQTPKRLYTTVTSDGKNEWDVMTYRLTVL